MATVYIFGAGASQAIFPSAPLMNDLLPTAFDILDASNSYDLPERAHSSLQATKEFVTDFYFYGAWPSSISESKEHLPRLEDILSQVDLAIQENRPLSDKYNLPFLRKLRDDLVCALCYVLWVQLEVQPHNHHNDDVSQLAREFLELLRPVDAVISLNYDLILDNRVRPYGEKVRYIPSPRYALLGSPRPKPYRVHGATSPFYKLHGSLNWLYCPVCQHIDVTVGQKGVMRYVYGEEDSRGHCPDCNALYESMIITPTLFKSYDNTFLNQLWREAENHVARADEVVFIGYSLPDADVQLRCMLKRALYRNGLRPRRGERHCKVRVIGRSPAPNEALYRYWRTFGEVEYEGSGFVTFMQRRLDEAAPH